MGEAKRKARARAALSSRSWAKGALVVVANDTRCHDWNGTRQDIELQQRYLSCVNALGINAQSYARRAAGYRMAFGPPIAGQPRLTPSGFGEPWETADVELSRLAVLWLGLREHVPNTGQKVEDIFVGKVLEIRFVGDRAQVLAETEREQNGQPFSGGEFQMMVGVAAGDYLLQLVEGDIRGLGWGPGHAKQLALAYGNRRGRI
jgi:hypothetical protein